MLEFKSILLAEDSSMDAELILEALAECHLVNTVTRVKDGVEVMEYLRCEGAWADRTPGNPAVVILDIKMPRMDGIATLAAIRADPKLKYLPAVILTSSREEEDLIRSYEHGINAYVVKPVKFNEFIEAVKDLGMFWAILNEQYPNGGRRGE